MDVPLLPDMTSTSDGDPRPEQWDGVGSTAAPAITITWESENPPFVTHGGSYQSLLATFRETLVETTGRKLRYLDLLATFVTLSEEDDRYAPHLCQLKLLAGAIARDTDFLMAIGGALNHGFVA